MYYLIHTLVALAAAAKGQDMCVSAQHIFDMSLSCAQHVHTAEWDVSPEYAERVAEQLTGIAAVESGLRARRQWRFGWDESSGAWGLWQIQPGAMIEAMGYIRRKQRLMERAGRWLFGQDQADAAPLYGLQDLRMMQFVSGWDRLGCLLCRVYLLRIPEAIPAGARAQATYWKDYWNTELGSGTIDKYIEAYDRLVRPVLETQR